MTSSASSSSSVVEAMPIGLSPAFLLLGLAFALYRLYRHVGSNDCPKELPWATGASTWWQRARSNAGDAVDGRKNLMAGYARYGRAGKPYVLPRMTFRPLVMLPAEQMGWVGRQSDADLDAKQSQINSFSLKYIQTTATIRDGSPHNFFHESVIRRDLTRQLGTLLPDVFDELRAGVEDLWGTDTENFREVRLYDSLTTVVSRTTNRVIFGLPLCRDELFNRVIVDYAVAVGTWGVLLNLVCPPLLKPLLGPLLTYPARKTGRKYHAMAVPVARERIREHRERRRDPERYRGLPESDDLLTWLTQAAAETGSAEESTPDALVTRLGFILFAALHTSSSTMTNALFDLSSGDAATARANWAELRREAETVLAQEEGGRWSRQALGRLVKTDSAIRESMRMSSLGHVASERRVTAKHGLTLPTGEHLPRGTAIAINMQQHRDENVYERPDDFLPFRFADMRGSGADVAAGGQDSQAEMLRKKNLSMVTASEDFMSFGSGKHTCPGRFFASQELKVLLAFIATHYEIETLPERPKNTWISTTEVPSATATIRVRRLKA